MVIKFGYVKKESMVGMKISRQKNTPQATPKKREKYFPELYTQSMNLKLNSRK